MSPEPSAEAQSLFDELIELDPAARVIRLLELAPDPALSQDTLSLLAAAERAGDFLGVLGAAEPTAPEHSGPDGMVAGRYRLERLLGAGAMGDVHLAWDEQLARPVALKFLRTAVPRADHAARARFYLEARAAARLEHPHVGTVHDIGETARGQLFIAMAYYPGESLRDRIAHGSIPPGEALRIAAQIAGALSAAHAAGIVHRDVKPANVLFDAEGAARLTDFGIAKLLTGADPTLPDMAVGTPAYMSPEQARGETVDSATDLWALGVILHEMLTGHRPRDGVDASIELLPSLRALLVTLLTADRARRPRDAAVVRQALEEIIATGDTALPALGSPSPGALPHPVTSFIGRDGELAEAHRLLGETRLLTLTGPGGTGKTRLALQLAASVRHRYADDVCFVSLAEIPDARLVPSATARALGVRDLGGAPLGDRAIAALGPRQLLLVLDNFEHVPRAATFVAAVLAACPAVSVLVTSRAPLGVQGEQEFPVPPLAPPLQTDTNAAENDAVRLFVSRARAVRPSFALDDESLGVVAEICRRLDGLPLALELAAARAKLLSPRALLSRLEHRFDLLRTEAPDRPARHGTMRAVIDWSYILLNEAERALFCRLVVFAGGIALDAAIAVSAAHANGSPTASAVFELLESLCNKSLLRQEEQPDVELRFLMLETVREFGLERLHAGDDAMAARRAHRAWCISLAERAASEMRGPAQAAWLDRLEREYANLRVALDGALTDPDGAVMDAARLAVALHRLWLTRGPLLEGSDYMRRVVAAMDASGAPALDAHLRAQVISGTAHLAGGRSLFREARDLFARSLALYRETDDRAGIATSLNNLAWQVWNLGDLAEGKAMSDEAKAIHEERGDELGVTLSRNNLAWIAMERADFATAERHFDAVIASHQRRGDARAAAFAMSWLGVLAARRGDLARAVALHESALEVGDAVADHGYRMLVLVRLAAARHALGEAGEHAALLEYEYVPALRQFGRLWPLAYALTELGTLLLDQGEPARARAALEEALEARRASGGAAGIAETLLLLGIAHHQSGDHPAAAVSLSHALIAARDYGAPLLVTDCLDAVARLALSAEHWRRGVPVLAAAAQARCALGVRRAPRYQLDDERLRSSLTSTLGDAPLAALWGSGAVMPPGEATALALTELGELTELRER